MANAETPLPSLFELNTKAVFQLQEGDYREAIAMMHKVIEMLRVETQNPGGFRLMPTSRTGYGSQAGNSVLHDVSIIPTPLDRSKKDIMEPSRALSEGIGDTLLFQPFEMGFATVFTNYEGLRGMALTCAMALYNLGLCHHHRQITTKQMKKKPLMAALRYYAMALNVIRSAMDDGSPEDVVLLSLAIQNNMGHVYSHLGELKRSMECIMDMRSLLVSTAGLWAHNNREIGVFTFFQISALAIPEHIFNKAPAA